MIDGVDETLSRWIGSVLEKEKVDVSLEGPRAGAAGRRTVHLVLLDLVPTPPLRGAKRPPLQFTLRYLVAASADKTADAHRMIGEVAFAALEKEDFDVEPEPAPLAVWQALGAPPRPSIVLRVPLRKERPEAKVPRVRFPLVLRPTAYETLEGTVVGPGDVPLTGARVEIPSLQRTAETDGQGRFRFAGVPADPPVRALRVRAKGKDLSFDLDGAARRDEPIVIRVEPLED